MKLVKCHYCGSDIYSKCPHCTQSNTKSVAVEERLRFYEPIGGKWLLDSLIGEGSFGKVYKVVNACDPDDIAALKVISIDKSDFGASKSRDIDSAITEIISEDTAPKEEAFYREIERAKNEIQLLRTLNDCEYLVNIRGDYQVERKAGEVVDLMIEMEFLTPITDYFKENKFSEAELLKIAVNICEALKYIHEKGIIHGDIKPDNIYRSETGTYKLGDFSVSRKKGETSLGWTLPYCAPELLSTGIVSVGADIYSLGVSLYLLSGGNINNIIGSSLGGGFGGSVRISPEFSDVIMKACVSDPKKRIKNVSEFLRMLKNINTVSEESIPFVRELSSISMTDVDKSGGNPVSVDVVPYSERTRTIQTLDCGIDQQEDRDKDNNLVYNIVVWATFTCGLALVPLLIFGLFRSCYRPDFPYINKVITELLYLGLTLSIINIKDLFSLRLRYKPRTTYVLILFLSLLILILTTVFFGIMTADDMSLLNDVDTAAPSLLYITIAMSSVSMCIGIFIQCLGVSGGRKKS